MARKLAAAVFSLGALHTGSVWSLGLGELSLESFLNEPLKAKVDLLNTGGLHGDEIKIRLATKEDFEKMGLERAYFLTSIKFEVEMDGEKAQIIMSSDDPVLEPYLDFIIEARWPSGRLLREYTVLIDPPVFDQSTPVISASQRVEEEEGIPAPAAERPGEPGGTQVDIRKSDLAPGEMPDRDFGADTSPTPTAGSRYMIRRDDTLWDVARQGRPEGASVHQTMLDIQRLNPNAFINGNINQIKAGYVIYLPAAGDISSEDMAAALEEVRQQNEDWQQDRATRAETASRPSLRISADPEPSEPAAESVVDTPIVTTTTTTSAAVDPAVREDLARAAQERSDLQRKLLVIQEQLESLQRTVNVKDEQIATLQAALAEQAGEEEEAPVDEPDMGVAPAADTGETQAVADTQATGEAAAPAAAKAEPAAAKPEPAAAKPATPAPKPKPQPKPVEPQSGGTISYLLYGLAGLLVAGLAVVALRRRRAGEEEEEVLGHEDTEAAFADVELQDQQLESEASAEAEPVAEAPESEAPKGEPGEVDLDTRGYGERRHDEYASDVDEVDALAEADIYIAYGRYPQAIDLLKNAIKAEPRNPAYRLKLLELHGDMGDRDAALEQYGELKDINEPGSLARAEKLLAGMGTSVADDMSEQAESGINPLDLIPESDEPLEADFSGLEIEALPSDGVIEDLDLSADFTENELDQEPLEDELVVAAESNGLSTKLDLARAYLDMGDEDGARQILEEVAAEGTEELRTEALELLTRIG
jgi:pilus assembly protein FimV